MIATCTLNPSLDYYLEFEDEIDDDKTNRSTLEYYEAGGKGINVSVVLNNLGIPTKAFGFLGGFAKDFYISLLSKYSYIQPNFTYIDGNTRINIKCVGKENISLNAVGPYITHESMENLKAKVLRMNEGDFFVLNGNTQPNLNDDVKEMLKELIGNGVKVIVDTNYDLLKEIVELKPFLIKTTAPELESCYGELDDSKDVAKVAKELHELGAENVVIIYEDEKAVLASSEGMYKCKFVHDEIVNSVGVGDSLVAGFIMNYIRSHDVVDSFRFGAACGSATAYSKSLATREKVDKCYEEVEVKKIDD